MTRIFDLKKITALLGLLLLVGTADTFAQRHRPVLHRKVVTKRKVVPAVPVYTVTSGTVIRVLISPKPLLNTRRSPAASARTML